MDWLGLFAVQGTLLISVTSLNLPNQNLRHPYSSLTLPFIAPFPQTSKFSLFLKSRSLITPITSSLYKFIAKISL